VRSAATGDQLQVWRPSQLNQNLIGFTLGSNNPADLNNLNMGGQAKSEQCSLVKTVNFPARLVDLSIPKSTLIYKDLIDNRYISNSEQQQVLHLIASLQDGTNCFIELLSFNQVAYTQPVAKCSQNDEKELTRPSESKRLRLSSTNTDFVVCLDQTFSGLLGVGLTRSSSLVAFRNLSFNKQVIPLVNLYEYHLLTGYDHWNLLMNTSPKHIDSLIEKLEEKYYSQVKSVQKMLFSRYHSILWTLYSRRPVVNIQLNQFKSFDIMIKLILNKAVSIVAYSVQLVLNMDQIKLEDSKDALTGFNVSSFWLNQEGSSQSTSESASATFSALNQIQFRNTLSEFLGDIVDQHSILRQIQLNDLAQFVLSKKSHELHVSQQLKHLFQFILDVALYLLDVIGLVKSSSGSSSKSYYGTSLIQDSLFIKEILKSIMFMKLVSAYSSTFQQSQQPTVTQQLVFQSMPIMPVRSSTQKDLLGDLFNIYVRVYLKLAEGGESSVLNDEEIAAQCSIIQAETVIRPLDEIFFTLKQPWTGPHSTIWSQVFRSQVDRLFDEEKSGRQPYPLFDIQRLIQFSRSAATKQCTRCGNFTESSRAELVSPANAGEVLNTARQNCIYVQDSCSERCLCGGYWVLSPLQ
jgi:hypothetical protein